MGKSCGEQKKLVWEDSTMVWASLMGIDQFSKTFHGKVNMFRQKRPPSNLRSHSPHIERDKKVVENLHKNLCKI